METSRGVAHLRSIEPALRHCSRRIRDQESGVCRAESLPGISVPIAGALRIDNGLHLVCSGAMLDDIRLWSNRRSASIRAGETRGQRLGED